MIVNIEMSNTLNYKVQGNHCTNKSFKTSLGLSKNLKKI